MSETCDAAVRPWPGDPAEAWSAVAEYAHTHRLSDRPAEVPRMDDLGIRLRRMSGFMNRAVGVLVLAAAAIGATALLRALSGDAYDAIIIAAVLLLVVVLVPLGVYFLLYPRRAWGPTAWVADNAMLCEAHPYRLRLRKHPSSAAVATILLGGGIDDESARMDDETAIRIVTACEQWAAQLENDPAAYAAFWRRWRREDPEVLPTGLLFGPDASGGFITCVDRQHRWFLLIPHRRRSRPDNPWHRAHALPIWWTSAHADSVGIDWGSMNGAS